MLKRSDVRDFVHLGLPESRFYFGCKGHMHAFRRVGYRSGAFPEDAISARLIGLRVPNGVEWMAAHEAKL